MALPGTPGHALLGIHPEGRTPALRKAMSPEGQAGLPLPAGAAENNPLSPL